MLRWLTSLCVLCVAVVLATEGENSKESGHIAVPEEVLRELETAFVDQRSPAARARDLQQSWSQLNGYFNDGTGPNGVTYFGPNPGPCAISYATRRSTRCKGSICRLPASVKAIRINIIGFDKRLDEWFETNDCANHPGTAYLYSTDFGDVSIGGIYLDIVPVDSSDTQLPSPQGFAPTPSIFISERSFRNRFRVLLTLNQVQTTLDSRIEIERLRLKRFKILDLPFDFADVWIGPIDFNKDNLGLDLRRSRQTISGSQHAISFRTLLYFRANQACSPRSPRSSPTVTQFLDTTCMYRSDKVTPTTRQTYYRGLNGAANQLDRRTETFAEGVVFDINLERNADNTWAPASCQFDFANNYATQSPGAQHTAQLGVYIDIGPTCSIIGIEVCQPVINWVLNSILLPLILKDILCQLINGMFYPYDNNGVISTNRGVINVGILTLYEFFRKYVETPLTTKQSAETVEDVTMPKLFRDFGYDWPSTGCATSSYCPYGPAVNFNTSGIFKSVSLGINNILGNVSTTPVYAAQNKLAIVEVIDILLGNKVGVVKLGICPPGVPPTCTVGFDCVGVCDGDIKAELKLVDYPRFSWDGEPVFDGFIQLNGMALYGVNSITRLKILDNGFADAQDTTPEFTHTLKNSFAMQYFGLEFDFLLVLRDGYWVHRPRYNPIGNRPKRQITMRAGMYIELVNIAVDIDLFLLLRPDLISDKKIGGIFGNFPDGFFLDRVRCAGFAMDAFQLSRLQLTGSLNVLRFQNLFGDLSTVIQRGVDIFNLGYRSATALYLPFLADGWARPRINEVLYNSTFDGRCDSAVNQPGVRCRRPDSEDKCISYPYYFSNTDPNRHINFYDSRVWNVIKGVVNDVVGGIPVRTGSASINTIIDTYLTWYIPILERETGVQLIKLPNVQFGPNPEMGNVDAPNRILIQADQGGNGNPNDDKFIEFSQFGVRNLATVHELSVKPTTAAQPRKFRLDFKLGSGKIWDRFNNRYITNGLLGFKFHLKMEVTDTTEGLPVTYSMDEADIFIQFGNLTVGTDIFALVNQNEFLDLTWGNLLDVACLLALVDDFDMQTLTIGFEQFRLRVDRSGLNWRNRDRNCPNDWTVVPCVTPPCVFNSATHGTPCTGNNQIVLRFSDALDRLAWEATTWGATVDNMVKYFFIGIANSTRATVNAFAKRQIPIAGCANYSVFGGNSPFALLDRLTQNASTVSEGFFAFWEKISVNQWNPRFPTVLQSAPSTTMKGSRKCGPGVPAGLCINYGVAPATYRVETGFPAARCDRGASRKGNYVTNPDACWEDRVAVSRADKDAVDLRTTFVVTELQKFLDKSGRKVVIDALDAIGSTSGNIIGDSIISYPNGTMLPDGRGRCIAVVGGEPSYCIDIDIDLDRAANASNVSKPQFSNDMFIPGFSVYFRRFRIFNFHTFDADPESFDLLEPYVPDMYNPDLSLRDTDARFTLAHRVKFTTGAGSLLRFALTVDISVADEFLRLNSPTPKKQVTDTMNLEFQFKDLDVQALTLTAMNKSRIAEVPFYYYLDPFGPERCFFSIFFENGLSLPQFQVYVSNIIGPQVNITAKSPANIKPNIFSPAIGELITSSIEIIVQLIKEDLPDATQGEIRKYINRVLKEVYLDPAISASRSPGSCPPPPPCGPPDSFCHYQNFMEETFTPIFNALNTVVGGNPVKTSQVDVNALVELGLNYSIMSPTGPQIFGNNSEISHPAVGDWIMKTVIDYANGPSRVRLTNLGLLGLDSIYKLTFERFPAKPYSLSFSLDMGNGTLLDGSKQPPIQFRADPLIIQAEFEAVVVAQRPAPQAPETLADNKFRVQIAFAGINVTALQQILVNKTDLLLLNIDQVTNTQCALSIVDKVTLETIAVQIADFNVNIPINECGDGNCPGPASFGRSPLNCKGTGVRCNLGLAVTQLRVEAERNNPIQPPAQSRPLTMLNTVLRNVGGAMVNGFNSITIWNKTRESCDVPKLIMDIISGVTNSTHALQLSNRLATNVTGVLSRPMPLVSADFTSITVQSHRLADSADRPIFIAELIQSAKDARGRKPAPEVVLREGSICNELNLPTLVRPLCNSFVTGNSNISAKIVEWTSQQPNLIEEQRDPRSIEDRVRIDVNKEQFYDVRTSTIVKSVTGYFDSNFNRLNTLLENIANSTTILRLERDGSVTLVVNITDAFFWIDENVLAGKTCEGEQRRPTFLLQDLLKESNWLIPRFRILPGMLEVKNFGSFSELVILRPYVANGEAARFTTRHEFGWRNPAKPLNITASIDLFFDKSFVSPVAPGQIEKDTLNITLSAQDLLVQVLTLLAVNTRELGEIRLGDFLNVDITQEFKRNCKAVTCLLKSIFDGGLYIPQLTVNVTNIIGPQFKTSGKLLSTGVEMLVDALIEIVVQLFRDDLAALTQGPLREGINDFLVRTLGDSKVEGACPPRRNYTQDYPLGQYFCSHNDTTGVSPLLTQSEAICRSKYNQRACKWSPPDGEITENTISCVYTQEVRVINFQTSRGLAQLKNFVNGSLMNPDSALYINKYLSAFASSFQTKLYEVDNFPLKYNGKEYGTVRLGIGKFTLGNLDTVDRFQLFDPAPYSVGGDSRYVNGEEYEPAPPRRLLLNTYSESEVALARRELAERPVFGYVDNKYMSRTAIGWNGGLGRPLTVYFEILFSFDELFVPRPDGPQDFVENHVSIKFNLFDFDFAIDLYMLVNIPRLMDLQIRSIGTLYELPCILAIFEDNGLIPTRANITYGTVGFELQCVNRCDSPFFSPLKNGGFSDSTSLSLRDSFTRTFQRITDFLIKFLASSDAQDFLDRQISISNEQCEAIKTGDFGLPDFGDTKAHPDAASAMGIAGLASLFAAFVGFALLVPVHFRRRDELMKRALLDAHSRGAEGKSKDEFELAERRLKSAFEHPMMPPVIKFAMPALIVVNIIMFATANFAAPGAIVELTLSIAGDTTYPITLLPFTLASSINDMWAAGVYPLAIIIALASGGWPYAKQLLMLFCWFAPSTVLHPNARGRMLEILDALGKWSLIDIYVLVMLMVGFRFYISSSLVESFSLLPPDVLVVDVVVTPGWGIFGFVLGVMGSLVVNHIMIWYHRKVVRMDEDLQDAILGTLVKDLRTPRIPLSRHRFNILDAEGRPYRYSITVRVMLVFWLAITFLLLIIGSVLPVIKFQFRGLAGLAIAFLDQNLASTTYSVVSVGTSLIDGARNTSESVLGILFIQILYILFSLVIPLILCLLLIAIWVVPLTLREQLLLYFVAEVLSAWEAVAVLIVSFIAAVLQISQLAQFIVEATTGNICGAVENQLERFFPDPEDAKCFNVIASLVPSSAVIIVAAILVIATSAVGFRLIHAAVTDRELAMRRKPPHSPGEMTGFTGFLIRRSLEAFGASQVQNAGSVANLYAQGQGAFDPRDSQLAPANPILAREMPQSMSGMQAGNPMFHGSLGGMSRGTHQSIDV